MRIKLALVSAIISGCASNNDKTIYSGDKTPYISPCKNESYYKLDSTRWTPIPVFERQFGAGNIADNCIRLYYLPSFEKEMVLDLCKEKSIVRKPDTGTVWESMQIIHRNENGAMLSGRVAKLSDSIPRIDIKIEALADSISKMAYLKMDSIDIWNMMSIEYKDCLTMDGVGIEVQTKKGTSKNHFIFSKLNYKDKRYSVISGILEAIYEGH